VALRAPDVSGEGQKAQAQARARRASSFACFGRFIGFAARRNRELAYRKKEHATGYL
jgi:hypothetical protein